MQCLNYARAFHGFICRKQVSLKIPHQVIRKIRNYYLLRCSSIQASSTHREQSRIYSYCLDNIRPPCHMFSHKMRSRHVLQRECLVAWLYVRGHTEDTCSDAQNKKTYTRASSSSAMKLGVFIDNITDTENAVIAHILRFVKKVFCMIPVNWIAHDRSIPR